MGKILQTTFQNAVENISGFYENLVDNPFYLFTSDKKPIICTYYNIDKSYSSLDPASKMNMDNIGTDSPLRYNKIKDFTLYGFDRIQLQTDLDEFGVEADKISGDCYIMPNAIIPTEGDYFEVDHIKDQKWLFIVTDMQKDTLDNGANVYKISYRLEYNQDFDLKSQVIHNFQYLEVREGTNIAKVVRCEDYDIAKLMDERASMLKRYFYDIFYNDKVQTFIFEELTGYRIYDEYLIEFLIRNKILNDGLDSKVYVIHQIPTQKTFSIDYDKTIFRIFEKKDLDHIDIANRIACIEEIKAYGTLFASRFEVYYKLHYIPNDLPGYNMTAIEDNLIFDIKNKNLVKEDCCCERSNLWKNILIKYFTGEPYTVEEVESLDNINFKYSKQAFYIMPLLIFCLEKAIMNTLK